MINNSVQTINISHNALITLLCNYTSILATIIVQLITFRGHVPIANVLPRFRRSIVVVVCRRRTEKWHFSVSDVHDTSRLLPFRTAQQPVYPNCGSKRQINM